MMSDVKEKKPCVPKLRFPEFQDSGEWENETLEAIYDFKSTNSLSREKLNYENGKVKNIHYGDIHTKFSTLFDIKKEVVPFINLSENLTKNKVENYCVKGDMVFADASEDLDDVGKSIEIINLNNEKVLSGLHTILARQKYKKITLGFGGYLFKSSRIRTQIKKESQGAKVLGLSKGRLSNIEVCYPSIEKEQKKIADCLSSLDELIAAQGEKIEALGRHKKGLMQNLFPKEKKTTPNLRFPAFQDAGEWEEKRLEKMVFYENGKAHEKDISDIGKYIVVNSKFISTEGKIKKYTNKGFCIAKKGDILMVLSDVPNGKAIAKCYLVEEDNLYTVNQRISKIVPKTNGSKFLLYILNRNKFYLEFDDGVKQTNLRKDDVLACPICHPSNPKEQQKIADFISSLDELISLHKQKLEALKSHKKGLMQNLFPATDEVAK